MRYLMIPGYEGSGDDHWQSAWERALGPRADRISPASWDHPDEADWRAAISRRVNGPTVLVAHSLGCLAAAAWLADGPSQDVVGAFLVAPPDPHGPSCPPATGFHCAPTRLPVPTLVISSSDDPYCDPKVSHHLATAWGATRIDLGPNGHINSASGLGDWEHGQQLLLAFVTGLPRSR